MIDVHRVESACNQSVPLQRAAYCSQAKRDVPYTVWQSVEEEVHGGCCNSQQTKGSADADAQRRRAPTLAIQKVELHRLWERKDARHRRRAALGGLRILSCWWASEKHTACLVGTGREQVARSGVNTGHAWAQAQAVPRCVWLVRIIEGTQGGLRGYASTTSIL